MDNDHNFNKAYFKQDKGPSLEELASYNYRNIKVFYRQEGINGNVGHPKPIKEELILKLPETSNVCPVIFGISYEHGKTNERTFYIRLEDKATQAYNHHPKSQNDYNSITNTLEILEKTLSSSRPQNKVEAMIKQAINVMSYNLSSLEVDAIFDERCLRHLKNYLRRLDNTIKKIYSKKTKENSRKKPSFDRFLERNAFF